jgi:riboflavin kinase/FMN adenylyltransferase
MGLAVRSEMPIPAVAPASAAIPVWDPARDGPLPTVLRRGIVMLGCFDGFHRGHKRLARMARTLVAPGAPVIMMCTDPHPRVHFAPQGPGFLIAPGPPAPTLLSQAGIDLVYAPRFDADFAALSPEDFIRQGLLRDLGASAAVVGRDFRFGHHRAGTVHTLRALGDRHGFSVHEQEDVRDGSGQRISSTAIRAFIAAGDLDNASRLLGYDWRVPVRRTARGWAFHARMIVPPDGAYGVSCLDIEETELDAGRVELRGGNIFSAGLDPATSGVRWTSLYGKQAG